jgi:ATP-dependent Lhr-like helicase
MRHQKTLVFTNRRALAERLAAELRQRLAQTRPGSDWYFVHHSSIAADLREAAEARMRDAAQQACTIATASLELGIDIGHLDLVVQIGAPYTVSSFVQRLGRSGRRGTPSRMCFYTLERLNNETDDSSTLEEVPWDFLQTIAIIQLYLEEQWIEPPLIPTMPLSLLYQQTMSVLRARTEMTPAQLARSILTLSPFQTISQDDYRLFLRHLIEIDHLALMDEGTLIIGMKGEQLTHFYHFYAIFANEQAWRVLAGTQEVGTVQQRPELDSIIGLAGYAWRVISINERGQTVHVERTKGAVRPGWLTYGGAQYHEHVMQQLRQVLQEETMYAYLSPVAKQRLTIVRELAQQSGWLRSCVVRLEPGRFVVFPWTSSRIVETIVHLLRHKNWYTRQTATGFRPYIEVIYDGDTGAVIKELRNLSPQVPELVTELVSQLKDSQLWRGKYDYLTPRALLEKAYMHDVLDVPGTMQWLATCS